MSFGSRIPACAFRAGARRGATAAMPRIPRPTATPFAASGGFAPGAGAGGPAPSASAGGSSFFGGSGRGVPSGAAGAGVRGMTTAAGTSALSLSGNTARTLTTQTARGLFTFTINLFDVDTRVSSCDGTPRPDLAPDSGLSVRLDLRPSMPLRQQGL
ncbi:hypothetical protein CAUPRSCDRAFT_10460 [Caulochytrium protostelioides]|uniref:Uncharacterized protein n=2 Tax=Caulochytrium protostelioides TaxID=1555241 RepID=A0A4P9WZ94_9FUNG|nr:hypothetical protein CAUPRSCDRAFT_10460 [Caulochytrium protostelioides]